MGSPEQPRSEPGEMSPEDKVPVGRFTESGLEVTSLEKKQAIPEKTEEGGRKEEPSEEEREALLSFQERIAKMSPEELKSMIQELMDFGYSANEYPGATTKNVREQKGSWLEKLVVDLGAD